MHVSSGKKSEMYVAPMSLLSHMLHAILCYTEKCSIYETPQMLFETYVYSIDIYEYIVLIYMHVLSHVLK